MSDTLTTTWRSGRLEDLVDLHWAAMQLPATLVDYVIVHELAHLAHPNHTPEFWSSVGRAMPDYESRKARLAQAGSRLWLA